MKYDGLVWLLLLLGPFIIMQRSLHYEIQAVFLLITRRLDISQVLFAILFFPGVLLHEISHYLSAHLLGVPTGRFSLIPRTAGKGKLRLGYVETARSDIVRDSLIGAAPLLVGGLFVAYAGVVQLSLPDLWGALQQGSLEKVRVTLLVIYSRADFWLWIYLIVVVSSTMMPSASDRSAWLPFGLLILGIFVASLLVGAGPWLLVNIAPQLNAAMQASALVFGISFIVHLIFWPSFWLLRKLLTRVTGLEVR